MSDDKIEQAEFHLIDGRGPQFCCLVAVCLGNDKCVSGVPCIAANTLNAVINVSKCGGDYCKLCKALAHLKLNKKIWRKRA
jgi:hypothetical protein